VSVRVDADGRIFVADAAAMVVRVYDASGRFLQQIGARGRNPGEFLDIGCMHLDGATLVVADDVSRRISRFSLEGELQATAAMHEQMVWPRELLQFRDELIFLFLPPQGTSGGAPALFHRYSADGRTYLGSFGSEAELLGTDPLAHLYSQGLPGKFWVDQKGGEILYAPELYDGRVRVLRRSGATWMLASELGGRRPAPAPSRAAQESSKALDIALRGTIKGEHFERVLDNWSRGIFRLRDGTVAHFTRSRDESGYWFGVELITTDGKLRHSPLRQLSAEGPVDFNVAWMDSAERFYIISGPAFPEIEVARLTR
jgi:hypothetical protein